MAKAFKLTRVDALPPKAGGGRRSLYADAVTQFVESGANVAKLDFPGKAPKTIQIGLLTAIGILGYEDIKVSMRHGDIYLHKADAE